MVAALRVTGQAVVGHLLPRRGIGDERADAGPDPGIAVERAHADADRVGVAEVAAEDRRAAVAAEPLLAAVFRLPVLQPVLTADDAKRAGRRMRVRRRRGAAAPLAALAVAVARDDERLGDLVAHGAAVASAGQGKLGHMRMLAHCRGGRSWSGPRTSWRRGGAGVGASWAGCRGGVTRSAHRAGPGSSRADVGGRWIEPGHEQLPLAGNALERVTAARGRRRDRIRRPGRRRCWRRAPRPGRRRHRSAPRGGPRSRRCRRLVARPRRREVRCARRRSSARLASRIASAQRIARAGPSKVASMPSPVPWTRRPR